MHLAGLVCLQILQAKDLDVSPSSVKASNLSQSKVIATPQWQDILFWGWKKYGQLILKDDGQQTFGAYPKVILNEIFTNWQFNQQHESDDYDNIWWLVYDMKCYDMSANSHSRPKHTKTIKYKLWEIYQKTSGRPSLPVNLICSRQGLEASHLDAILSNLVTIKL